MDATCLRALALIVIIAFIKFPSVQGTNKPPVWDESSIRILTDGIREDTPLGTRLGKLRCIDPDGDDVSYSKTKGNAVLVNVRGEVFLSVELDFEDKDSIGYDLGFSCFDTDIFGLAIHNPVILELELTVDDANDIAPEFNVRSNDGYSFSVSEDDKSGFILTPTIQIKDLDRGLNAELSNLYIICNSPFPGELVGLPETSIETCNKFNLVSVQLTEGVYQANLTLTSELDFEQRKVYSSKLVAIDNPADESLRLSTTINIQINVQDAQDVKPFFVNLGASTIVSEGAKKGETINMFIQAKDGDLGDQRPVKIVMMEDPLNAFTLGPSVEVPNDPGVYQAQLRVDNALDREELVGNYDFIVKVIELDKITGAETLDTATATYSVQVSDIDDEPPQFEQGLYKVEVTEMEFTTEIVQIPGLRMVCTDRDEPQNAKYKVRILSQSFPDVFSISPGVDFTGTAILFLTVDNARFLDYDKEEYRKQTVVLEARSLGSIPLSSTTTVSITLTDINDNKPVFEKKSYAFRVSESIRDLPYKIDTIKANDQDSGDNGKVTYRLEGGTSNKFEIDPKSGELTMVSRVDFETTPLYVFLVYANDEGQDSQFGQVQVTVEVINYNDQYPQFEQPIYQTSVNEDKLVFLTPITIRAKDTEAGTGTINYRIIKGQTADNAFNLDLVSGSLTLNRKLEYGVNGVYKLEVEATDNGVPPLTTTTNVTINVIDQNNFKPKIVPNLYTNIVSELVEPGLVVAKIKGTDEDQGEFGKITYRIVSGAFDNFVIDPDSGVVTVNDPQTFDYDQQNFYSIKIVGTDGGAPQLFDTATLNVDITDANNKSPQFEETIYIATVDEEKPVNFVILTVFAKDLDSTKKLVYSIIPSSISARNGAGNLLTSTNRYNYKEAIGVHPDNGDVYIKNKLDKEEALEITLTIQVEDVNSQTTDQIDTTLISITVTGKVNTDLSFDPIENIIVNERSPKGNEITTVVARDPTTQDAIRNYQQIGNISPFFEVVKNTGQVRIKRQIDYEQDPHTHRIVIQATADDNFRTVTATVTIKVNDDNDNRPKFDRAEYISYVDEDAPPLTRIANLHATDRDNGSFGEIEYKIAGGLDADNFKIYKASHGVDVLIDRGVELNFNERDYYELDVIAVDNPQKKFSNVQLFTSVKLKIFIIDKNNHKPVFLEESSVRRMAVAETANLGKSVGTIVATDDDFGVNGEITYDLRITGDPSSARGVQLFTIVPRAGIITVASSLVGFGGNVYKMQVFAQDGGEPFLSNTLNLEIDVLSTENDDGNPIWYRPTNNHIFFVPEETANYIITENNDPFIFEVAPRTGNEIVFRLSNLSSNAESFSVDRNTGVITVVDSLDREIRDSYHLLIYAEDTSDPAKIRTGRQIIIQLQDKDDNQPTFTNYKSYSVCGEPIDRPLEIYFDENVERGKTVYTLKACDPDENSRIFYFPYNDMEECRIHNARSGLTITKNGDIVTNKYIDYEVDKTFTVCAIALPHDSTVTRRKRAIDISSLPHNVAYIIFHVRDQNDNRPIFPDDNVAAVMATDARDYPVIILDAEDKDGKGFNVPVYTITETKFYADGARSPTYPGKAFVMKNNELHPDPPRGYTFQDFSKGRFVLTIKAEDPVNPAFTDTQTITVYVHNSGQAMKVILKMPPTNGIAFGEDIVKELNDLNRNYAFRYLHVSVHEGKDGIDKRWTDVCFIAVDANSHSILNTLELVNVMARREYQNVLDKEAYDIKDIGKCYPSTSSEEQMKWKDLWWVLVVLAIFLGFCALMFIIVIFFMHRRYRRYMETEKTYLVPQ